MLGCHPRCPVPGPDTAARPPFPSCKQVVASAQGTQENDEGFGWTFCNFELFS